MKNPEPVSLPLLVVESISTTDGESLAAIPAIESGARSITLVEVVRCGELSKATLPISPPATPAIKDIASAMYHVTCIARFTGAIAA